MEMKGFLLVNGKKMYFMETDYAIKCESVITDFMKGVAKANKVNEETLERCLKDKATREDLKDRISKATCELRTTSDKHLQYYLIKEKYSMQSIPMHESECLVFI